MNDELFRRTYSRNESEADRLDRNYSEMLQELRVAQTGVQILFAFLLSIAFQQRFNDIDAFQLTVYVITLLCAAISALLLTVLILAVAGRSRAVKLLVIAALVTVGAVAVFGGELIVSLLDQLVGRKVFDLFVQGDVNVGEAAGRYEAYRAGVEMFTIYPFGIGWGMVSQMFDSGRVVPGLSVLTSRGLLSLYLEILASAGVLGFASYAAFHVSKIRRAARSSVTEAPYVLFGLVALSLHHAFVLEFWFPMLWFYFALTDALTARERVRLGHAPTASSESISLGRPPLARSESGARITGHEVAWDH